MKREDKEKVLSIITVLLMLAMPFMMDRIGTAQFIIIVCVVFLVTLLWYSYGPIEPKNKSK